MEAVQDIDRSDSDTFAGIPDPADEPTMELWPRTGQLLKLSRSATYDAANRGEIPTLRFGRRLVVPTAEQEAGCVMLT